MFLNNLFDFFSPAMRFWCSNYPFFLKIRVIAIVMETEIKKNLKFVIKTLKVSVQNKIWAPGGQKDLFIGAHYKLSGIKRAHWAP